MSVVRKRIGEPVEYRDYLIEARYMGPDLLCYVDGEQIGNFYLNRDAAIQAGTRYVDEKEKAKKK